jgi:transcriptional regulator with XRE-family HTH domain
MAKRLSAADRIERLTSEGYSRKEIAQATGYSASQIGRIARGETSGEKALGALREFSGLGKRAQAEAIGGGRRLEHARPAPPPRPRPAPRPEPRKVSSLRRAEGQLSALENGGVSKVIIHVTPKDGKSFTLGAKGGIYIDTIQGSDSFGGFVSGQAQAQEYDDEIDWSLADYEIEEYY